MGDAKQGGQRKAVINPSPGDVTADALLWGSPALLAQVLKGFLAETLRPILGEIQPSSPTQPLGSCFWSSFGQ